MKPPVWHIIKKDLARFRLHLALWCAILIGRAVCAEWAGAPQNSALQAGAMMWAALVFLFNVHLVVRVLAEDSPLKEAAFWRTRPVTGGQMLAAKVIFITAWTMLFPAGVVAAAGVVYGFTVGELLAVMAGQIVLHGFIGLVFLTAAAFFERVIASVICFMLVGVFAQLATTVRVPTETVERFDPTSLVVTKAILATGFLLAGCGAACWLVYRSRKRALAMAFAVAGLAAMKLITMHWTWDCLGWITVLNNKEPRKDAAYKVSLSQVESSGRSNINGVDYRWITAAINQPATKEFDNFKPYRTEGYIIWNHGEKSIHNHSVSFPDLQNQIAVLRSLGIEKVDRPAYMGRELKSINLAQLREDELGKLKQTEAEWRGHIASVTGRTEVKARMSVMSGASVETGAYRLAITDLRMDERELRLVISERSADLPTWANDTWASIERFSNRAESYALINTRRGESIFPNGFGGGGGSMNNMLFNYAKFELSFRVEPRFNNASPAKWSEWLKDAELVRFQFVEEKRVMTDELVVPLTYR